MTNIIITGAAKIRVLGFGTIQLDGRDPIQVRHNQPVAVNHQAKLNISGQVLVNFSGPGLFQAQGVRIISTGDIVVNFLSLQRIYAAGRGLVYAEGCNVRVAGEQTVIAVNCPSADVHDNATLIARDCLQVSASNSSTLVASHCEHILAIEKTTLKASDCGEVLIAEGDDEFKPTVESSRCKIIIPVHHDFEIHDGIVEEVYVRRESVQKAA